MVSERTLLRREFLQSAVMYGPGKGLDGELKGWWEGFLKPLEPCEGTGRWANRFRLEASMGLYSEFAAYVSRAHGVGMVGYSGQPGMVIVRSGCSRSVLDVVAGMGMSLNVAQGASGGEWEWGGVKKGMAGWEMDRVRGRRLEEIMAVKEMAGVMGLEMKPMGGYRFRTSGEWMRGPWGMYLGLTVMKLVVMRPEMVWGVGSREERVGRLLAWWKSWDDDARRAGWVLGKRGWPKEEGGLGKMWGIGLAGDAAGWGAVCGGKFAVPRNPQPTAKDLKLAEWLILGQAGSVPFSSPVMWSVPKGRVWGPKVAGNRELKGLLHGVCLPEWVTGVLPYKGRGSDASPVVLPSRFVGAKARMDKELGIVSRVVMGERSIQVEEEWLRRNGERFVRALGMLPGACRVGEVGVRDVPAAKKKKSLSRVVYPI